MQLPCKCLLPVKCIAGTCVICFRKPVSGLSELCFRVCQQPAGNTSDSVNIQLLDFGRPCLQRHGPPPVSRAPLLPRGSFVSRCVSQHSSHLTRIAHLVFLQCANLSSSPVSIARQHGSPPHPPREHLLGSEHAALACSELWNSSHSQSLT